MKVKDILGYYEKIPSGRRPFGSTSLNTNNLNLWLNSLINEIDKFKPDIFFIWLQFKPFNYKLIDICRNKNIKIRFIHEGFIPGSISIEENGMMAESKQTEEYPKSINIDRKYLKNAASILTHLKIKKYERKPSSKNTSKLISEKYILVCGSNDEECGIKYGGIKRFFKHSPLGINSLELVKIVCEYGYLKNYKVIYKPHPNLAANQNYKTSKEFERLKDLNNKYKNLLEIIYEGDLYQLIENSILNVTLTSAVAYNCCFIDAPVAIFGKLPLSNKNCCYEVKDINQISRIFDDAIIHKTKEIHKANFLLHIAHLLSTNLYWSESSPIYSSGKNFKDSSYKNCLEPLSNFSRIFEKKYLIENDPHTSKINYLNQLINPNHNKKSLNIVFLCLFPREGYSG